MKVLFGDNSRDNISLGLGHRIITSGVKIICPNNKIIQNTNQIITSDKNG